MGKIVGGFVDMEVPIFDVYGEPIDEARALLSVCKPMEVNLSGTVYETVDNHGYRVSERDPINYNGNEIPVFSVCGSAW